LIGVLDYYLPRVISEIVAVLPGESRERTPRGARQTIQDDTSYSAYNEQIKALDAARDTQYQSVLGTNVFTALQKEQDPGYE
jgi:hypothetical protein